MVYIPYYQKQLKVRINGGNLNVVFLIYPTKLNDFFGGWLLGVVDFFG